MGDVGRAVNPYLVALAAVVSACGGGGGSTGDAGTDTDTDSDTDSDADTDTDTDTDSDSDSDSDTDNDTDTDVDADAGSDGGADAGTDDCVESELPPAGYFDFYEFCVPVGDACNDDVDALLGAYGGFAGACHVGSAGWIGCDTTSEYHCMLDPASSVSMELLCALTLLECVEAIGGAVWE